MHPDYLSTRFALASTVSSGVTAVPVQHHHAHIAACLADNGVQGPIIGVAFDGTGFGSDGRIWGGEFLVADYHRFRRLGHFQYVPLPGGDAAIQRPYRMAVSYLYCLLGVDTLNRDYPFLSTIDEREIDIIKKQVDGEINSPLTSSCGRLFDAVSALVGLNNQVDYEGQAAVDLEMAADESETGSYPFSIIEREDADIVHFDEMFAAIVNDMDRSVPGASISARFHRTLARVITRMCSGLSKKTGLRQVALSGGVFQNRLLLRLATAALEREGFAVLTHKRVPANDGGVSLGQAVIANFAENGRS
jgi:hydrogenase maturation protein HypF